MGARGKEKRAFGLHDRVDALEALGACGGSLSSRLYVDRKSSSPPRRPGPRSAPSRTEDRPPDRIPPPITDGLSPPVPLVTDPPRRSPSTVAASAPVPPPLEDFEFEVTCER